MSSLQQSPLARCGSGSGWRPVCSQPARSVRPEPSVDAQLAIRWCCSTRLLPSRTRTRRTALPRAALVVKGLPQLQRYRTRTLPRATEGTLRRQLVERWQPHHR